MSALALLAAIALQRPTILAVRTESVETRAAIKVVSSAPFNEVSVRTEGADLLLSFQADAAPGLAAPQTLPPIESVVLERAAGRVQVRVRVASGVPHEVRRDGAELTVLFGTRPDLRELYARIFPPAGAAEAEATPDSRSVAAERPGESRESREGLALGALRLRPAVNVTYVDADSTVESATPVRDQYVEARPRVGVELPLGSADLKASYEARLRQGSVFPLTETTSHFADASLSLPLGTLATLTAADHYSRGVLETTEIDPGYEYFFGLGRFERHSPSAALRMNLAGRIDLDLGGLYDRMQVDEQSGFFSYERWGGRAGLSAELGASLRLALGYGYENVPTPPERPEAESQTHYVSLDLEGEILPLVTGRLSVGYRDQRSPNAAPSGQRFRGMTFGARLSKEFTPSMTLGLAGARSTQLSAFESNGFYVNSTVGAELTLPLPLTFALRGAAGYTWNDYRVPAAELGVPREDRILGWSVGLSRPITAWSYLRADYTRTRRRSNIEAFTTDTDGFTAQLGLGWF